MTRLLVRLFIKEAIKPETRMSDRPGVLAANVRQLLLFLEKLCWALVTGAISIVADAVNNLPMPASIITLLA